ncbi:aminotransferase [Temperatibacter marinus]|uniref:Aminotransferase n=1 Tax=Temperatibacter marinus TaxID=1456591 RepID=A0AA52EGH1_9PROT|nr:aminotransferase [Temperatibacter marinus]WND02089.1 aminotransferase [Temperatibacter marinus]
MMTDQEKTIQDLDAKHHLHPFMPHPDIARKGARVITRAEGCYIYDDSGHKILDAMAGLWTTQIGTGREEMVQTAAEAMRQLSYYNTFFYTTHPNVARLAEKIAEKTPGDISKIHFASSGSEAVDTAYKLVKYYWNLKGQPQRKQFIARENAYHGSTAVAASLCGLSGMHEKYDLPIDGIHHVGPAPHYYNNGGEMTEDAFRDHCVQAIEDKILEIGPDNVAAFIGEPIQGAGGLIIPPEGYWTKVEALCRKYGILLWCDEVITGWGRTGKWFGSEYYGVTPDIITMAKGLTSGYQPLSAVALGGDIAETISQEEGEMVHGFTYSGHPVATAVGLKNIEIMEREGLIDTPDQDEKISYFSEQLSLLNDHPLVGETRTLGLLGAIELVKDKTTRARYSDEENVGFICREHCFDSGLVMRSVGNTMILCPPLVITTEQIDELIAKAREALDKTYSQVSG